MLTQRANQILKILEQPGSKIVQVKAGNNAFTVVIDKDGHSHPVTGTTLWRISPFISLVKTAEYEGCVRVYQKAR